MTLGYLENKFCVSHLRNSCDRYARKLDKGVLKWGGGCPPFSSYAASQKSITWQQCRDLHFWLNMGNEGYADPVT